MRIRIIIILVISLLLGSCISSKNVTRKYYTIELPDVKTGDIDTTVYFKANCEILGVTVSNVYAGNKIANRSKSNEISYYQYHQWAVRPTLAIKEEISEYFSAGNLFGGIRSRYINTDVEYGVKAWVSRLEVMERKNEFVARLDIELALVDMDKGKVLLTHSASQDQVLNSKDLNLFSQTISSMIYDELVNFEIAVRESPGLSIKPVRE